MPRSGPAWPPGWWASRTGSPSRSRRPRSRPTARPARPRRPGSSTHPAILEPASGRVVAVTTNGDATIAPAIDNGDGTYTATIKASRTADDETITATAGAVRATAVLHEVDSRITVRLKKDTLVADGRSTTTAT